MPSKLTELATICDKLTTSKVLERKKGADRLKALLSTSEVLKELGKGSSHDGFGVCWTSVFEAAGNALLQELKGQKSRSGLKKPDMYSVVKFVLQQASTCQTHDGKPVLSPEVVFEHITVMVSEYAHILASEYAFLITSYFLTPTLWRHWKTADLFNLGKLLVKYIKGLNRAQPGFNAGPVSLAIERITVYMLQRIDVRPMKFLTHFKDFFTGVKDCNPQTAQNLLAAANHLCERGAVNSRLQLSHFGADISMKLLQLWRGTKDVYKLEAIRFFRLQLVIADHHSDSKDVWQDVLWKLYEVLCQEIGSVKTSHKLAGDKLPHLWTDDFFSLLAHVCVILLPDGQRLSEVSQSVADSQYSSGRPAKRRRILSGWESLKANIVDCKDYQSQIAWIKVITLVVGQSGGDGFSDEQMKDVLTVMSQLLSSIKRPAVLTELHRCLLQLIDQKCLQEVDCEGCWYRVTVLAISLVERNHAAFYVLLYRLLKIGKLHDKSQLIRLIKRSVASPVSSQGISWLSHYLNKHQLALFPLLSPSDVEPMSLSSDVTYQQMSRQQLWQHVWLARQLLQTVNNEEGLCSVIEASATVCAELFGNILAALVCKEPLTPIESNTDDRQTLVDVVTAVYKSMEFPTQTAPTAASEAPPPTVLQGVFGEINSLLVDKLQLSARLLNGTDNLSEYVTDSLWLMEMITAYLKAVGTNVGSQAISLALKELWAELSSKLVERSGELLPDTSYLKGLLAVMSAQSALLEMDKRLASTLVSLAVTVMEKLSLSQNSLSSLQSSGSTSDCAFAIPALPEISSSSSSCASDMGIVSPLTAEEQQLLKILLTLVHSSISSPAVCDDVIDLLSRIPYDQSAGHARVVIEVLTCAATHWLQVEHETMLSLLFHTRGLIENYHSDPQIGEASLKVINKLIPLVSSAQKLTNGQKEDLGEKIILIMNGLVTQLYVRKDDTDGSYQLMPCYGVEYRLALVDTLQQLAKADRHRNWRTAASKRCSLSLDVQSYLIKALLDKDYVVRKTAIDVIDVLFTTEVDGQDQALASKEQEKLFDLVYAEIRSLLAVSEAMNELARLDEERTRTATLLSLFRKIFLSSAACSRKSLCAIFVFLNENKHITCELIAKVLGSAVPTSPYNSVKDMCEYSLGYVAHQWIAMQYKLESFPISLFEHADLNTFYRKHLSTFAPLAFGMGQVWTELLSITSLSPCDIVCSELPSLLLSCLPRIANKMSRGHDCKLLYEEMEALLTSNNRQMLQLLRDKLADILFALYTSAWDFSAVHSTEPEPNPPHFTKAQIGVTKTYLLRLLRRGGVDGNSLLSVLARKPVSVTSLHCKLAAHVCSIKHPFELRQRVSAYQHFISDLLDELSAPSLSACQQHLVESVVSAAVNIISWLQSDLPFQRRESFERYTSAAISQLIQCVTPVVAGLINSSQVLSNVIPRMTYCLLELSAHSDHNVLSASTALLKLIWVENSGRFLALADNMEPLPEVAGFDAPFGTSHHSLPQVIDAECFCIKLHQTLQRVITLSEVICTSSELSNCAGGGSTASHLTSTDKLLSWGVIYEHPKSTKTSQISENLEDEKSSNNYPTLPGTEMYLNYGCFPDTLVASYSNRSLSQDFLEDASCPIDGFIYLDLAWHCTIQFTYEMLHQTRAIFGESLAKAIACYQPLHVA